MNVWCNFIVGVYIALLLLFPTFFKKKTAAKRTRRPWVCPIHVYEALGYDNLVPCTPFLNWIPLKFSFLKLNTPFLDERAFFS
jgi:hypothetical protein